MSKEKKQDERSGNDREGKKARKMQRKRGSRRESANKQTPELNAETGVEQGTRKCIATIEVGREAQKVYGSVYARCTLTVVKSG